MSTRAFLIAITATAVLGVAAAPAVASLANEVAQGRTIANQLHAGTTSCAKLSDSDFEHLGEYVMEQRLGSRSAHEAMNSRMESMMGTTYADRMHEALGRSYAGCDTGNAGVAGGMMGGGMMGSQNWSWMRGNGWRHMTRADWQRVGNGVMGPGMMWGGHSGWSTAAIVAVSVGALALGGLIVFALVRRPRRPSTPSPAA